MSANQIRVSEMMLNFTIMLRVDVHLTSLCLVILGVEVRFLIRLQPITPNFNEVVDLQKSIHTLHPGHDSTSIIDGTPSPAVSDKATALKWYVTKRLATTIIQVASLGIYIRFNKF